MTNDDFGDRMKAFEQVEAGRRAMPLLPICVRIDGKGFSRWTKGLSRPYDQRLSDLMIETTKYLVDKTNAKIGYTQSDEISLILYTETYGSEIFFDGKLQKLTSVIASLTTAFFNSRKDMVDPTKDPAIFDCRVWNVPTLMEATNTLLWREQDATKNSISMAARHYYSHNELQNKNGAEMQELLFKKGVNWNDYPAFFKRGTFVRRVKELRHLTPEEMIVIPESFRPTGPVQRSTIRIMDMPPFGKVINRVDVIFQGANPKLETPDPDFDTPLGQGKKVGIISGPVSSADNVFTS